MDLSDAQRLDWLRLIRTEGIGPRSFQQLINRFGGAAAALEALPDLTQRKGRPITPISRAQAEDEVAALARLGGLFVASGDAAYPALLRATDAAPPLIALRGDPTILARPAVAIVGSRNASAAGGAFTDRLANALGEAGLVIVSGLARGIDARAHKASLATGTVAVMAGGHDKIYPANHAFLAQAILDAGGAVIAEMPMGWQPRAQDFPRRNRIVSGLSYGSVVVEAARRSGSLITARYALEQNREVFAVPGSPLDPRAEGTNDLIRQGAILVTDADHILEVLGPIIERGAVPEAAPARKRPDLADQPDFWDELDFEGGPSGPASDGSPEPEFEPGDERSRILALLGPGPVATDELARAAECEVRTVQTILLELELDGHIERQGSGMVALARR